MTDKTSTADKPAESNLVKQTSKLLLADATPEKPSTGSEKSDTNLPLPNLILEHTSESHPTSETTKGDTTTITNSNGTQVIEDKNQRVEQINYPNNGGSSKFSYDSHGNILFIVNSDGSHWAQQDNKLVNFDKNNQPTGLTASDTVEQSKGIFSIGPSASGTEIDPKDGSFVVHTQSGSETHQPDGTTVIQTSGGASITENNKNQVTEIANSAGGVTQFSYDGNGNVSSITNPDGSSWKPDLDHPGQLIEYKNNQATGATISNKISFGDGSQPNVDGTSINLADGSYTLGDSSQGFDTLYRPNGSSVDYSMVPDPANPGKTMEQVNKIVNADKSVQLFNYDQTSRQLVTTIMENPNGQITQLIANSNPNRVTNFTYDGDKLTGIDGPNGTWKLENGELVNQATGEKAPDIVTQGDEYSPDAKGVTISTDGQFSIAKTDGDHEVYQLSGSVLNYKSVNIDGTPVEQVQKITYPDGSMRGFTYDSSGNMTAVGSNDGVIWVADYSTQPPTWSQSNLAIPTGKTEQATVIVEPNGQIDFSPWDSSNSQPGARTVITPDGKVHGVSSSDTLTEPTSGNEWWVQ